MKLVLEPRCLFDGSVVATADHAADAATPAKSMVDAADSPAKDTPAAVPAAASASAPANPDARDIVFVDQRVAGWEQMVQNIQPNVQVVVLDLHRDAVSQVTEALEGRNDLHSIQFLTHGEAGEIIAGNGAINSAVLAAKADQVAGWRDHLAEGADVLIWGCDVGAGAKGQALLSDLHSLTGADVAASADATGAAAKGGNWTLESRTGTIESDLPLTAAAAASYDALLADPVPSVTLGTVGNVMIGSTFSTTVVFDNTHAAQEGFGPFVDIFVPYLGADGVYNASSNSYTSSADGVTFTGASYLGTAISASDIVTVTLKDIDAATPGIQVKHPFALGTDGQPLTITVPSGFVAGDQMVVIKLPFGSFTATQPIATLNLNFSLSANADSAWNFNLAAIGGFQYGRDALNNPATDQSLRGTDSAANQGTTVTGLQTSAGTATLLNMTATAITYPGEGETATGPDFPATYRITLTPASVVDATNPINNLNVNFTLPENVKYTGGTIVIGGSGAGTITTVPAQAVSGDLSDDVVGITLTSMTGVTTIDIPIYVPRTSEAGAQILAQADGQAQTIQLPAAYTASNGAWTPKDSRDTAMNNVTATGNQADAQFTAKSLAVQVASSIQNDVGSNGFSPGDTLIYQLKFQISDYFGLDDLVLSHILSDGLIVDTSYVPELSITKNGVTTNSIVFGAHGNATTQTYDGTEVVSQSGSNAYWDYTRNGDGDANTAASDGSTTLHFKVGALLDNQFGANGSILQGGATNASGNAAPNGKTEGVVTFRVKVQDKYTDSYPASGTRDVKEKDSATTSLTGSGKLLNVSGVDTTNTISDTSSSSHTVTQGSLTLSIVAVNGSSTIPATMAPGDLVTYSMKYALTSADYMNFSMTGYLPLPVFKVGDLDANGTSVANGSAVAAYGGGNTYPDMATYKLVHAPSAVTGATIDTVANSITFTLANNSDTANPGSEYVEVYVTAKLTGDPFADGLYLTALGQSTHQNSPAASLASSSIKRIQLAEPDLKLKKGVISLVNDDGTAKTGTYSAGTPSFLLGAGNATANPISGTVPGTIASASGIDSDLNAGPDANDTVRICITVENEGHSANGAFDIKLSDVLPTGYTVADVSNFHVTGGDGTALGYTGTLTNFFDGTGIVINDRGASSGALAVTGAANKANMLFVTYDLKLKSTETAHHTILDGTTDKARILAFANSEGGTNFVNNGVALGGTAADIADGATIITDGYSPTIQIVGRADGATPTQAAPATSATATVGEIVRYRITTKIPEGGANNGVELRVTLPSGITYLAGNADVALVSDGGLTSSTVTAAVAGSTNAVTPTTSFTAIDASNPQAPVFQLGNLTNADTDTNSEYVVIEFNAVVTNVGANITGKTLDATVLVHDSQANSSASPAARVTVAEPVLTIKKTVDSVDQATGEVTYKVVVTNTGTVPAYDVSLTDPKAVSNVGNIVLGSISGSTAGGATGLLTTGSTVGQLAATVDSIPVGGSVTITYRAPVLDATQAVPQAQATVTWTSLPEDAGVAPSHFGSTGGLPGTTNGERTTYTANDTVGLGTASGRVWVELGAQDNTYAVTDEPLQGITVTGRWAGVDGTFNTADDLVYTTTTAADGRYSFILPDGNTKVQVTAPGAAGGPSADATAVYDTQGSATDSTAQITVAHNAVSNVNFAFIRNDTAPVISNWSTSPVTITIGDTTPVKLSNTGATGLADIQIDRMGITYNNATLTVNRQGGAVATDVFDGTNGLSFTGGNVVLNGTTLGTYTQIGGTLTIALNGAATPTLVRGIFDNLTYKSTLASPPAGTITIKATISDGNIANQQGNGGNLTSAAALAQVTFAPPAEQKIPTDTSQTPQKDPGKPLPIESLDTAPKPTPIYTMPGDKQGGSDKSSGTDAGFRQSLTEFVRDWGANRQGEPELMLVGSVGNRFIIPNQPASIEVPPNIFRHTNPNEPLAFEARRPDGSPLPKWLSFDARNLTFKGVPPNFAKGAVDIVIVAKDSHGNKAEAQFRILVGQNVGDQTPVSEGTRQKPAKADRPGGEKTAPKRGADAAHGRTSFTAQLRDSGRMGALEKARALLDALS